MSGKETVMTIIKHDFGKKGRDTVRRFTKLMSLEAQFESKVLANPIPYLERASERISQIEMALSEAAQAAAAPPFPPAHGGAPETVAVDKAEYERLLRCKALVDAALAKL
jgi:hypothetical protein